MPKNPAPNKLEAILTMIDNILSKFENRRRLTIAKDSLTAIFHALIGVHKYNNPFSQFNKKLDAEIDSAWSQIDYLLEDYRIEANASYTEYSDLGDAELEHENISLKKDLEQYNKKIEEADDINLPGDDDFEQEYNFEIAKYNKWKKALGRPPFMQIFDYKKIIANVDKVADKNSDPVERDPYAETKKSFVSKIVSYFTGKARQYLSISLATVIKLIIPSEVFFALPAFLFLTPDNPGAALFGAIIFVACLYIVGHGLGFFLLRFRRHSLVESKTDDQASEYVIKTHYDYFYSTLVVIAICISFFLVSTGASLRAMVPDASESDIALRNLNDEIALKSYSLKNMGVASADADSQLIVELHDLQTKLHNEEERRTRIRNRSLIPVTVDGYLAACVYLTILIAPIIQLIISQDPYLEYYLISSNLNNLWEEKARRLNIKASSKAILEAGYTETEKKIEQIEKQISVRAAKRNGNSEIQGFISEHKNNIQARFKMATTKWKTKRQSTYFNLYTLFKGGYLKNAYPTLFEEEKS